MHDPAPLTDAEKAYFDTLGQVASSPRPEALSLRRMVLDGEHDVAVAGQQVLRTETGEVAGWQPLALIVSDELVQRLSTVDGEAAAPHAPEGLEGPA
jgi:hypothetical protein